MEDLKLILNKSYGIFVLGDDIKNYLFLPHTLEHRNEKSFSYDSYSFYEGSITIWVGDDNKIETIRCDTDCYWQERNLIGMLYEDFCGLVSQQADKEDIFYIPISSNRGQNQKAYIFYSLGLQVWVWRKKIVTILISNYDED
jgi:hypothetical protein